MKIQYYRDGKKLKFTWEENGKILSGTVPDSMVDKGEAKIAKYAEKYINDRPQRIQRVRKEKEREKEREKRIADTNISIIIRHGDGKTPKGRIVDYRGDNDRGLITILLESPKKYRGEDSVYNCFGMAMAGIHVFDDDGYLTQWAIDRGKESLIRIYENGKTRENGKKREGVITTLVTKLNKNKPR